MCNIYIQLKTWLCALSETNKKNIFSCSLFQFLIKILLYFIFIRSGFDLEMHKNSNLMRLEGGDLLSLMYFNPKYINQPY